MLAILLILSLSIVPFYGQSPEQAPPPVFKSNVKVVNVFATVRNKQGEIVTNLSKDDFTLQEDGKVQPIHYFARETDLPLDLGLLVDTSLSQRRLIDQERTASYTFFKTVLREDKDKAFVIHFDREIELLQDLTSSRQKLEAALDKLDTPEMQRASTQSHGGGYPSGQDPNDPNGGGYPGRGSHHRGGGTTLYDAVFLASDEIMQKQPGRKALIILSDGVDTGSKVSLDRAIESAQRADTMVYSILFADPQAYSNHEGGYGRPHIGMGGGGGGWGGPMGGGGRRGGGYPPPQQQQSHPDGKKVLERISRETGGRFFEVSKKQPIDKIYEELEQELRSQYSLGFSPDRTESDSDYHRITLTTKDKNLTVQARDGYYAKQ